MEVIVNFLSMCESDSQEAIVTLSEWLLVFVIEITQAFEMDFVSVLKCVNKNLATFTGTREST